MSHIFGSVHLGKPTSSPFRHPFASLEFSDRVLFLALKKKVTSKKSELFPFEVNMIDPINDELIAVRDLPKWFKERIGVRLSPSTIYRQIFHGVSGVKLETIVVSGKRYSTEPAILVFLRDSTIAKNRPPASTSGDCVMENRGSENCNSKGHKEAVAFLNREGI
jgi:hypothetical protein